MAQRGRHGGTRREGLAKLAKRLSLVGRGGVAVAACAIVAILACVGAVGSCATRGLVVERAAAVESEPAADPAASSVEDGAESPAVEESSSGERPDEGQHPSVEADSPDAAAVPCVVVHVEGAVVAPGVYELRQEGAPRVVDAVDAAGGLSEDADTTLINMAALVEDGSKVYVPHEGEQPSGAQLASSGTSSSGAAITSGSAGIPTDAGMVNINTAGIDELQTLPGIGAVTAQAIVDERESGGPFSCPEDIMRVSGIGEKKYAKLEGRICV